MLCDSMVWCVLSTPRAARSPHLVSSLRLAVRWTRTEHNTTCEPSRPHMPRRYDRPTTDAYTNRVLPLALQLLSPCVRDAFVMKLSHGADAYMPDDHTTSPEEQISRGASCGMPVVAPPVGSRIQPRGGSHQKLLERSRISRPVMEACDRSTVLAASFAEMFAQGEGAAERLVAALLWRFPCVGSTPLQDVQCREPLLHLSD